MVRCPNCKCEESKVVYTRHFPDEVRRRRVCDFCKYRFTTVERLRNGENEGAICGIDSTA